MLNITIQNGILKANNEEIDIHMFKLGSKVQETLLYFIRNRIDLQFTKYSNYISYNTQNVHASKKLIRALEQDKLIRLNRLMKQPA